MTQSEQLTALLAPSMAEVLEQMCFILAEQQVCAAAEASAGPSICAQVAFAGAARGTCGISVPTKAAVRIAADFLGESAEGAASTPGELHDVIGEMANMVCGNLLGKAFAQTKCTLGTPEIISCSPALMQNSVALLWEQGGEMRCWLTLES